MARLTRNPPAQAMGHVYVGSLPGTQDAGRAGAATLRIDFARAKGLQRVQHVACAPSVRASLCRLLSSL
jgi:hypothetical protein